MARLTNMDPETDRSHMALAVKLSKLSRLARGRWTNPSICGGGDRQTDKVRSSLEAFAETMFKDTTPSKVLF